MARALVFAHYDQDGLWADYVVAALRQYRAAVDRLVVVSASARALPPTLRPVVDTFIPRDNIGYDFCSWRAGIESLGPLDAWEELICTNDSVYGPLANLAPVLADPRVADADLWGMCLSEQGTRRRGKVSCPHLQSWFFAMRRPLLESPAFQGFWQSVVPLDRKDDIIDRYEIGMSEHFLQAGFRMAALYDAREHAPATRRELWPHLAIREPKRSWRHLRKMRDTPHNPSECFPGRLLDAGVPFVKAGLFRVNHYGLNLGHVLDGVAAATPYDVRLIRQHLARVGGKPLESGGIRAILSPPSR